MGYIVPFVYCYRDLADTNIHNFAEVVAYRQQISLRLASSVVHAIIY